MLAVGTLALVALRASAEEEQPAPVSTAPDLKLPEEWVRSDHEPRDDVAEVQSWLDAQSGCGALYARASSGGSDVEQLLNGFQTRLSTSSIQLTEAKAAVGERLSFSRQRPYLVGELQFLPPNEQGFGLLACYWNRRDPGYCQKICARTFASLPAN
jgi:hypothetical protein